MILNLKKIKNPLLANFLYSISAQILSLMVNVIMILIVPKFMGVIDFSYWQLFLLYTAYIGFFHLGLNDGIYLKEGGKKRSEINLINISSQFKISLLFQLFVSLILLVITNFFQFSMDKNLVFLFTFILIPITNGSFFLMYLLQATNEIKRYVTSIFIEKFFFVGCIFILIINNIGEYEAYIFVFTLSKVVSFVYLIFNFRDLVFSKFGSLSFTLKLIRGNVTVGISLLFANLSGLFIMGYPRLVIESEWGIKTFGVISFSLIIVSFFLMFVNQIGLILFPHLRRINVDASKNIYTNLRRKLNIFLPIIFVIYVPLIVIMEMWLPQYKDSFKYIYLILPIVLYESKVNILYNTYLKVYRKEKQILVVNIFVLMFSIFSINIIVQYLESVTYVLLVLILSIALRSIILEIIVEKLLGLKKSKSIFTQNLVIMSFIIISMLYQSNYERFLIGVVSYAFYLFTIKFNNKLEE
ncbi:O-antigen/teichoic acid export membrane protein [Exiguobacterium sp. PvP048]|uniref:hypothetical protein n=1 Tax=unclassified Exiguobacterium TaxID=2644629 RepID=UPI0033952ED3